MHVCHDVDLLMDWEYSFHSQDSEYLVIHYLASSSTKDTDVTSQSMFA